MSFVSPGQLYYEKQKVIQDRDHILAYAEFLRNEAGVNDTLPVDVDKIFKHFGIPEPLLTPLPQQQGMLLDADHGVILINSTDPEKRQKFTKAHELAEMLFWVLPQRKDLGGGAPLNRPGGFTEYTKEFLCNWTAANLLMPTNYVQSQIKQHGGVNFDCARTIANTCDVSFSAALVQMAQNSGNGYFVALWRMKNKPDDFKKQPDASQMTMFGVSKAIAQKKLRIEWCLGASPKLSIPKNKSTDETSCIHQAWETNKPTSGKVKIIFGARNATWFSSENMSFTSNDEKHVISLMKKI